MVVKSRFRYAMAGGANAVVFVSALSMGAELVLVEHGEGRVPSVVAENALPETLQAAQELAEYFEKVTGAKLQLFQGEPSPPPAQAIWVGFQPRLREIFPNVSFDLTKPEEILLVANRQHLAILGRDRQLDGHSVECGTANAVYTFIQEYLNVRWLWPGPIGEDIIRQQTVSLEPFEYRYSPPFRQRCTVLRLSMRDEWRGHAHDWTRRQRLQLDSFVSHPGGHAFADW